MHVPTPGTDSHPCRRSATEAFSSNHTYPYTSVTMFFLLCLPSQSFANFEFTFVRELESRISIIDDEPPSPLGISKYRCIPQVLAPENFRKLTLLINYRRRLTAASCRGSADRLLNGPCDEKAIDIFFSAHDIM